MTRTPAYIALGSNLGDRRANIEMALRMLGATPAIEVVQVSSLLENPAVGGPVGAPPFLNAAAMLETSLTPHNLLAAMHAVERRLGRVRRERWEPRLVDLDLLLFGNQVIQDANLTVPHPLLQQRRFVLQPLVEIAPDAIHPILHRSIRELWSALQGQY